uniref:ATPase inhibitor, mitochondrial n=1 Tax=Sarcophilus harrisii TaxID=9305 RepID=A0A7N4NHP1_SARHA
MACPSVAAARLGLGLWGARTVQARGYNLEYSRQVWRALPRCPAGAGRTRPSSLLSLRLLSPQFSSKAGDDMGRSAGAIREAGGAFGQREKAEEDRYFREKSKEQLASLRKHHQEEIMHHEKEIQRLQKEIERHKNQMKKLKDD